MGILVFDGAAELAQRLGPCSRLVDLNSCLLRSARFLAIPTASLLVLQDVDLENILATQLDQFYDVAEWEGLRRILRNLDKVDLAAYGIEESVQSLHDRYKIQLRDMTSYVEKTYNMGAGTLQGGVFQYDFAAQNDREIWGDF